MARSRWLDDDEQRAWRAYLRMQSRLTAALNRQLQSESGLSLADYDVLVQLTEAPDGRLRPYELQQALDWEQSRLSHHLGRMQHRNLVTREECADDRRGAYIQVTDDGRQAIENAAPGHVATVRSLFFDALSRQQIAMIDELSSRILDRVDAAARP